MPTYKLYASNEEEFVELPAEAFRHCGAIWAYIDVCPDSDGDWILGVNLPPKAEPKVEPKLEEDPDKPDQDVDKMELEQFQQRQARLKKEEEEEGGPAPERKTVPSYPVDKQHLDFIVEYLHRHKDDEEEMPPEDLQKYRELDEWEKEKLEPFQGLRAVALLFAAKFLGNFRLLQVTARNVARQLETRNEEEMQQHFGVRANFTKEQEEATRARFPQYFA